MGPGATHKVSQKDPNYGDSFKKRQNLNRPRTRKKIELLIKTLPTKKPKVHNYPTVSKKALPGWLLPENRGFFGALCRHHVAPFGAGH